MKSICVLSSQSSCRLAAYLGSSFAKKELNKHDKERKDEQEKFENELDYRQ